MKNLLLVFFALAGSLIAQPAPNYLPWLEGPLSRKLDLSDDQRTQIRHVLRDFRSRLIDLRGEAAKADGEMRDLLAQDPVDEYKAAEAIERLVKARAELTRAYSQMSLRIRQALTASQWEEMARRAPRRAPARSGRQPGRRSPRPSQQ